MIGKSFLEVQDKAFCLNLFLTTTQSYSRGATTLLEAPYHLGSKTCDSRRKALRPLLMIGGVALRLEVLEAMF